MKIALILILLFIVVTNIMASFYIARAVAYKKKQKILQIFLIWIFPLVGSLFFSYFLWIDRQKFKRQKDFGDSPPPYYTGAEHTGGGGGHSVD